MALSILDGNQSATTLSTILSSGQHITAHTVVSLGTQAITDMRGAVSGSVVSISNFPASQVISGTVTANPTGTQTIAGTVAIGAGTAQIGNVTASNLDAVLDQYEVNAQEKSFAVVASLNGQGYVSDSAKSHITNSVTIGSLPAISGTVTVGNTVTIAGTVTANPTGTQTIAGSVTLGAGTAEIGTVKPAKSQSGNAQFLSVDDGSGKLFTSTLLTAGTAQIGSVTASISNSVVTFYPMQGTTVTNSNFTSTTASTTLVSAVAGREVLTVFNEGAGNLHISPGATATTISYQIRLSPGDYWECPQGQLSLAHTAVFATAGTARVTEVS